MSFQSRFYTSAYAFFALLIVSGSSSFLSSQTAVTTSQANQTVSSRERTATATFLTAPVLALSNVPSGVVSTDLDGDGKPDLIVASAATGKVSVYLGKGKGEFAAPTDYSVSGHPSAVVAADIDGDGVKDIVTANAADGTVSVLLTIAGGRLATARIYSVGVNPDLLMAGDLNGDGKQDIIVASKTAKALAVLLNDGQGSLQKASVQALGKVPAAVAVSDLNGDKHIDVAVAYEDGTVETLLGAGDGSLASSGTFKGSSSRLSSIYSADFNGDGKPDLAVADPDRRLLTIFLGNGDGTFSKNASYKVGNQPSSISAADTNGDGALDLVSVNNGSNTLSILLGKGDGSFRIANEVTVGNGPVALATADFEGDGYTGLAVINTSANSINVISGKGDGTFRAAPSYSGDLSPKAIASGDLNGDGLPDLVVTNYCGSDVKCGTNGSLSVYLAQKTGGYQLAATQAIGSGPVSVALVDLNGDGILDVVALNRIDKSLSVLLGVGDGTLQAPTTSPLVGSPVALVAKDLDKDGKPDLAIVSDCGSAKCSQRGSVDTYFGLGDGSFRVGSSTPVSYSPTSIAAGDLNGDGVADLVVANACGADASCNSAGTATVLLGAASGTFTAQPDISLNNRPSSIALRASSGATALDLVVSHESDNTVAVLSGNGDGTFKTPYLYTVGTSPRSLVVADLNGDGRPDVAVANGKDSTVSVLYGQADGTLVSGNAYPVATGPEALIAVASTPGVPASLVTANGNSASTPPGSEITSLTNLGPNSVTGTTTMLSITATSGTVNSAFTLQATISPAPPDGELVTFSSDVSQFTDCTNPAPIASGVASCTTSQLTAGSRTLTANYPGDGTFGSSFDNEPQTVNPVAATLALAGPSTAPTVNQSVTYTATLGAGSGSFTPTAPSGTVSFTVTGQTGVTCASVVLTGGGTTASCTLTPVSAGPISVVANYASDPNFTVSGSSNTVSQTVNPVAATLTLAGPTAAPTVNQSVTYTATLGAGAGSFTPTAPSGTVSFTVTGQTGVTCANVTLSGGGTTASCTLTPVAAGQVSVVANYASDPNYTVTGSSNTVTQTVNPVAATLTLAGPAAAPTVNQSVTYTATLGAGSGSFTPTAPAGTVSFTVTGQAGATCANVTLSGGGTTATCTFTAIASGQVSVVANYASDPNFTVTGSSNTVNQTVSPVAATLTVAGPTTAPTVNQSVTYTATLGAGSGSFTPTTPAGTVSFSITGQTGATCANVTLSGGGTTANCTFTAVAAGPVSVVANYASDPNFTVTGSSNTVNQTVAAVAASLTLPTPNATPRVNQSITYTATLGPGSGSFSPTAPSGMISFTIGGQQGLTCAPTTVSATALAASCTIVPTSAGTITVTATYSNDNNFTVANGSAPVNQPVNMVTDTLSLSSSSMTSTVNQNVTFTATLGPAGSFSPTIPTGTISFSANGSPISSCQTQPISLNTSNSNYAATCMVASLTTFADTITATYLGDPNFSGSSAAAITQSVTPVPAATSVSANLTSAVVNQPVIFTATVQGMPSGPVIPTGTVNFTQGSNTLCSNSSLTAASGTTATATCQTTFTTVNTSGYTVVATYVPSGTNFTAGTQGTSSPVPVQPGATSVALSSLPTSSFVNQSVTFTATVTQSQYTGATVPTGSVTFVDQTRSPFTTLCPNVALSGSTATCTVPLSYQAPHMIVATFSATGSNFSGSTSSVFPQTVSATSTSIKVTTSNPSPNVKQPITLTATVTPAYAGATIPQGTVTFTDGLTASNLCTAVSITTAQVTCPATFTTAGVHPITATYTPSSDMNFTGSTSDILQQSVGSGTTTLQISPTTTTLVVNQPIIFTSVLTPQYAGPPYPAGKVVFTDASTNTAICTATLNADGTVPACTAYSFPTSGPRTVSAAFTPSDANFSPSTPATASVTVNAATTSLQITTSTSTPVVDQSVMFNATLTPQYAGSAVPVGIVTFTDTSTKSTVCTVSLDTMGNVPACPSYAFPGVGGRTVSAVFTPSLTNTNFITSNTPSVTETVSQSGSMVATPSISAASGSTLAFAVNEQLIFSTVVTPAGGNSGPTVPGGMVVFTANKATICTATSISSAGVATCTAPLGAAGNYSVTATYNGDSNFLSSPASSALTQPIAPGQTTITLTSSLPSSSSSTLLSVATRPVTFTATLNVSSPAAIGAIPLAGTISFTSGGNVTVPSSCTSTVTNTAGTAYLCTVTYPAGTASSFPVTATFVPSTSNFVFSPGTSNSLSLAIEDFSVNFVSGATGSFQPFPGPLSVTQSSSSMSDPFNAVPTLAATISPVSGFAENLSYACSLPSAATGLSCSVAPGTGLGSQSVVFTASSTAALGTYVATITASDTVTTSLSRSMTLTVNVGGSVPTSLSPGVTGTVAVPFTVSAPQDNFTFACAQIVVASTHLPTSLLKCNPVSTSGSLSSGSASFTISPGIQTSMNLPLSGPGSRIFAASFFCVPLLALAGCFGRGRFASKNFFRFLAAVTLLASAVQTIGCGGGFNVPAQNGASTTGTYLVQVTATDMSQSSKPVYYAVIPVVVQ